VQTDFSQADVTNLNLKFADVDGAIFTGAIGVASIRGLADARNRSKAIFDQ
jgi:uncharacterized protein YjbI with pentapeptide repeats